MAKHAVPKTNAMRILEQENIPYTVHTYEHKDGAIDGISVAKKLGQDICRVYKTLVTVGASREHYVFVLCVAKELDLKKAAAAVGEKSVSMIPVAQINAVTGYIRGGCSPVGMKKRFVTVVDEAAREQETICVSAGKIGLQVELRPADLIKASGAVFAQITAGE